MDNFNDSKALAIEIAKILDKKKAQDVRVLKVESLTYYDLEHLWADGEPVDISEYLTPDSSIE